MDSVLKIRQGLTKNKASEVVPLFPIANNGLVDRVKEMNETAVV